MDRMMNIVLLFLPTLSFSIICTAAFNMTARMAEWDGEYEHGDEVLRKLKLFARGKNITTMDEYHFDKSKREVEFDRMDTRQGVRVDAVAYKNSRNGHASLGECTAGTHKYVGKEMYSDNFEVNYRYYHQSGRFSSREFSNVMGGVGISVFGGAFGASAKVRVQESVKRDGRSLLIYSHFVIHKGIISLVNPQVGTNWQECTRQQKHFYLRDILTGLDDYLMVQLRFASEAKRKETEVKIKIKLLFFSITKTIRRVKTSLKTDVDLSIYHIKTYPHRIEKTYQFNGVGDLDNGIKMVETLEQSRSQISKDIMNAMDNDQNLHLEYFFLPCLIKTIAEALPFKRTNNLILAELIERTNELKSVLEDIGSIKVELKNAAQKSKLEEFEKDIKFRLNKIKGWKEKSQLSQNYVLKLLDLYGKDRAPYYYERKLNRIIDEK